MSFTYCRFDLHHDALAVSNGSPRFGPYRRFLATDLLTTTGAMPRGGTDRLNRDADHQRGDDHR